MRLPRVLPTTVLGLLALAVVGPLVVPIPPLAGTVPPEELADESSQFLDLELSGAKLRVHFKTAGSEGPAIVLLHGFGASLFTWRDVIEPLSKTGRVIAYDRPAFGLTSRPLEGEWTGPSPYGPEGQVELVVALLDRLGIDRAILVGNSAGGTVALQTALQHPERAQGLVLVDAAVYAGGGGPTWLRPLYGTPQLKRLGPVLVRGFVDRLAERVIELSWHDPSKITPAIVEGYQKPLRAQNWDRGLWEMVQATSAPRLAERLGEVRTPTLVITGDDDRIVPTEQSVRLSREIAGSRLVVIADCGHLPHEERPTEFLSAVRDFVATLAVADSTQSEP